MIHRFLLPARCLALIAAVGCHPVEATRAPDSALDLDDGLDSLQDSVLWIESYGSMGSGVAWSFDSVLTAYHVIDDGISVVRTRSGDECEVLEVRAFPGHDLAWIVVDPSSCALDPIAVAPQAPRQGDRVRGLGHPLGLAWSLSSGVVSHPARDLERGGPLYLQTDAALNPGMSGGPIVDEYGRLVAISSLLLTRSGMYAGLAFGVHLDVVLADAEEAGVSRG
jgi:S1-C subfamily serine protease